MNGFEEAAWEAHQFFGDLGVSYAIIDGMAVQQWGEPRLTRDIDITVAAPLDELDALLRRVLNHFPARLDDALAFARRNRVILVTASNGLPLDIALGLPGYEDEVMQRAVAVEVEPGKALRICSAEDLIICKAVAGRPQDLRDIEGIVHRQGQKLKADLIRHWLAHFAVILDRQDITEPFESSWRKVRSDLPCAPVPSFVLP
ncbi:MAG: hypothetical protein ACRDHL_05230 [Candidatus Promineifilaceae bacterium]